MASNEEIVERIALLQQRLTAQEQRINNVQTTRFQLSADQIIRNFNEIQPFSGEDSYKLKSFLKNVNNAEALCGEANIELRTYCLSRVISGKIIGRANNVILEIADADRTWANVVHTLMTRFRPKTTVHQLLFTAKETKVHNIKDLFNKLAQCKSEANEICDFNAAEHYTYGIIDKELVQILRSKLIPIVQLQIDQNKTLFELENSLCQTEIYYSHDVVKDEYRIRNSKGNSIVTKNNSNQQNNGQQYYAPLFSNYSSPNYHSRFQTPQYQNTNDHRNASNTSNTHNDYNRNHNTNTNANYHRSQQTNPFRNQFNSTNQNQNNPSTSRRAEPMEVDSIQREMSARNEVNFSDLPPPINFR